MSCVSVSGALVGVAGLGRGFSLGETGAPGGYAMAASFEGFARRLHLALDSAGFERGRARTGALAKDFNVSRETARKWLNGLTLPELDRMIGLATRARVAFEWLATGRGEMTLEGIRVHDGGAPYADPDTQQLVHLIAGMSDRRRRALIEFLQDNGGAPSSTGEVHG
jgi:transcriptional regulator with XRE-family HTH domain